MKHILMISHSQQEFEYHIQRPGTSRGARVGETYSYTPVYPGGDFLRLRGKTFNAIDFTPGSHDLAFIKTVFDSAKVDPAYEPVIPTPKIWMVYVEGERTPAFEHLSKSGAIGEAIRLSRLTGKKAYALEAVEMYKSGIKIDFTR